MPHACLHSAAQAGAHLGPAVPQFVVQVHVCLHRGTATQHWLTLAKGKQGSTQSRLVTCDAYNHHALHTARALIGTSRAGARLPAEGHSHAALLAYPGQGQAGQGALGAVMLITTTHHTLLGP